MFKNLSIPQIALVSTLILIFCSQLGCSKELPSDNLSIKPTATFILETVSPTLVPTTKPTSSTPVLSESLESQYQNAYNLFHLGKYSQAIKATNEVLKVDPNHYKSLNIKGIALSFSDNFEEGMDNIDKALSIAPQYWYASFNKGLAYSYRKQFDNALLWYNKSLELENYTWTHYGIAAVYGQKGDVASCVKSLKIAMGMDPAVKDVAKGEKDFDGVRNAPEFIELMK